MVQDLGQRGPRLDGLVQALVLGPVPYLLLRCLLILWLLVMYRDVGLADRWLTSRWVLFRLLTTVSSVVGMVLRSGRTRHRTSYPDSPPIYYGLLIGGLR